MVLPDKKGAGGGGFFAVRESILPFVRSLNLDIVFGVGYFDVHLNLFATIAACDYFSLQQKF